MNTIYDGSFVLGQTSATNFVAGPGIKIDSPSAGTVRIGNDETVLWENADNSTNPDISLSEPLSNFNYIQFDYALSKNSELSNFSYNSLSCVMPTQNLMVNKRLCINGMMPDGTNNGTLVIRNIIYTIGNDAETLTVNKAYQLYFNNTTWSYGTTNMIVYRVIGINRISGGN